MNYGAIYIMIHNCLGLVLAFGLETLPLAFIFTSVGATT